MASWGSKLSAPCWGLTAIGYMAEEAAVDNCTASPSRLGTMVSQYANPDRQGSDL